MGLTDPERMSSVNSLEPSLAIACVEFARVMYDCWLDETEAMRADDPTRDAVTRMGQLQYEHAPHSLQDNDPDADHDPIGHALHVLTSVAEATADDVPPTQGTHAAAPDPDQPPAGHDAQATEPNELALVPASHAMHADCPTYGLNWPRLHWAHTVEAVAAVAVELVPVGHAVHVPGPRSGL